MSNTYTCDSVRTHTHTHTIYGYRVIEMGFASVRVLLSGQTSIADRPQIHTDTHRYTQFHTETHKDSGTHTHIYAHSITSIVSFSDASTAIGTRGAGPAVRCA